MFPVFEHVPAYPAVFVVFWGAAAVFVLAMARHLRVFAAAKAVQPQPRPLGDIPRRLGGLVEYALIQTRMFKDPRAGLMHAGIFWGFILLTIGTANIVTGGVIQSIVSIPFGGAIWAAIAAMQNVVAVLVLASIAWAFERRLVSKPRRLTFNRDALLILAMIGGVVATELLAQVVEFARFGDQPGAFVAAALAGPLRSGLGQGALDLLFAALWWAHIVLVAAFLVYLPFSKHLHIATAFPNIWYPEARAPRRAASDGPRARGRDLRAALAAGPRLEGPPRRLHLHRMRPLPAGMPRPQHWEAAQSQGVHHGSAGHVGRGRAWSRPHPEQPDRARGVRARRRDAGRRPDGGQDRR